MNNKLASVKLSFDKTKDGILSLKLRVTHQRAQRRFSFPFKKGVLVSERDFDRLLKYHEKRNERVGEEIRLLYSKVHPFIIKAEALCSSIQPFSFDIFKRKLHESNIVGQADENDLLTQFEKKSAAMFQAGQIGNGNNYKSAQQSIARFLNSLNNEELAEFLLPRPEAGKKLRIPFELITSSFLSLYEQWMLSHGKAPRTKDGVETPASSTTVSMYVRCIRTLFNDAVDRKLVDRENYPFGRRRYTVPAGKSVKKALPRTDIQKILNYQAEPHSFEERSRDFWIFSYLSNGMNFADILRLRWKDIDLESSVLTFTREKTARTKKADQRKIKVSLFPQSSDIINKYKTKNSNPESFVFPFIGSGQAPARQKAIISQFIKVTNKHMQAIALKLEITGNVNTYAARHSFSTILLHSEAPIAFISQSLGHTNIKTTQNYLDSFDDEKTKKYLTALL